MVKTLPIQETQLPNYNSIKNKQAAFYSRAACVFKGFQVVIHKYIQTFSG
jgi:hypothetical protein